MSVSQGLGLNPPGGGGGGGPVTQVVSSVDVEIATAAISVEVDDNAQITVELVTPQIVLCEEN